jgi:hypothetical protein
MRYCLINILVSYKFMEEDHSSKSIIFGEEYINILNTLSILDDSFTKENIFVDTCLNKLYQKLGIKLSTSEETTLSKKVLKILSKPKGSLELQNILPELTSSMCDMLFEAVSKNFNYYEFLTDKG